MAAIGAPRSASSRSSKPMAFCALQASPRAVSTLRLSPCVDEPSPDQRFMTTAEIPLDPSALPDIMVDAAELFGIQTKMKVPAFKRATEQVPERDDAYRFDRETTLAI